MTESDDQIAKLSELLHEAAETHHVVYRIVDGDDPDWASWYADWLLDLSELPSCSAASPCAATWYMRSCNSTATTRTQTQSDRWEDGYASRTRDAVRALTRRVQGRAASSYVPPNPVSSAASDDVPRQAAGQRSTGHAE